MDFKVLTVKVGNVWTISSSECDKAVVDRGKKVSGGDGRTIYQGYVE